jgi:hypothetical protein
MISVKVAVKVVSYIDYLAVSDDSEDEGGQGQDRDEDDISSVTDETLKMLEDSDPSGYDELRGIIVARTKDDGRWLLNICFINLIKLSFQNE